MQKNPSQIENRPLQPLLYIVRGKQYAFNSDDTKIFSFLKDKYIESNKKLAKQTCVWEDKSPKDFRKQFVEFIKDMAKKLPKKDKPKQPKQTEKDSGAKQPEKHIFGNLRSNLLEIMKLLAIYEILPQMKNPTALDLSKQLQAMSEKIKNRLKQSNMNKELRDPNQKCGQDKKFMTVHNNHNQKVKALEAKLEEEKKIFRENETGFKDFFYPKNLALDIMEEKTQGQNTYLGHHMGYHTGQTGIRYAEIHRQNLHVNRQAFEVGQNKVNNLEYVSHIMNAERLSQITQHPIQMINFLEHEKERLRYELLSKNREINQLLSTRTRNYQQIQKYITEINLLKKQVDQLKYAIQIQKASLQQNKTKNDLRIDQLTKNITQKDNNIKVLNQNISEKNKIIAQLSSQNNGVCNDVFQNYPSNSVETQTLPSSIQPNHSHNQKVQNPLQQQAKINLEKQEIQKNQRSILYKPERNVDQTRTNPKFVSLKQADDRKNRPSTNSKIKQQLLNEMRQKSLARESSKQNEPNLQKKNSDKIYKVSQSKVIQEEKQTQSLLIESRKYDLEAKIAELNRQNYSLRLNLQNQIRKNRELQRNQMKKNRELQQKILSEAKERFETQKHELILKVQEINKMHKQEITLLEILQKENQLLMSENQKLLIEKSRNHQAGEQHQELMQALQTSNIELDNSNQNLQTQMAMQKREIEQTKCEANWLKQENERLKQEVKKLGTLLKVQKQDFQMEIIETNEKMFELSSQKGKLQEKLMIKEEEYKKVKEKFEKTQEMIKELLENETIPNGQHLIW